jgi:hypothetical protein
LSDKGELRFLAWSRRPTALIKCRGVQTDLDLDSLADTEIADAIPHLLADYSAECKDWTVVAAEHWKKGRWDRVDELLNAGFRCASDIWCSETYVVAKTL